MPPDLPLYPHNHLLYIICSVLGSSNGITCVLCKNCLFDFLLVSYCEKFAHSSNDKTDHLIILTLFPMLLLPQTSPPPASPFRQVLFEDQNIHPLLVTDFCPCYPFLDLNLDLHASSPPTTSHPLTLPSNPPSPPILALFSS